MENGKVFGLRSAVCRQKRARERPSTYRLRPAAYSLIALAIANAASAEQTALPPANEALAHSARVWEAHDRGDLARLALEKLVAARPDSPDALVELGELQLRMGEMPGAEQALARLNERFPKSAAAATFATEFRVATRDRLQLASIERLLQIGHRAEARKALTYLFPQGAPGGVLGIRYYQVLARSGEWETARVGLQTLVDEHPDDPRYRFALAKHLIDAKQTAAAGIRELNALATRDDIRVSEVDDALVRAIKKLGYSQVPIEVLTAYRERHPDDADVNDLLAARARAEQEKRLLDEGGLTAVMPKRLLGDRDIEHLLSIYQARSAAERVRDLRSLTQLQLPNRTDTRPSSPTYWVVRSQQSAQADRMAQAALEMEAAVLMQEGDYERAIDIAQRLTIHDIEESGELLAAASRAAPLSNWLFETYVRWLIANDHATDALAMLDARPLKGKWQAQDRDALRARALEVRADKALSTADDAAAMADLEQAIRLSPSYPWSRYRLAELYSKHGDAERGRALFREGVLAAAHNPDMNYAQALYLSSIEDYAGALAALESIAQGERSQGMRDLYDRVSVAEARRQARAAYLAGDLEEARAKLLGVESLAHTNLDRARELAFSWIELGDVEHGLGLLEPYVQREPVATEALLSWAQVLNSAEDAQRLQTTLVELRGRSLTEQDRREVARLQRSLDLRVVRNLRREGKLAQAARRLDELLAADPNDRTLRIARADLYLAVGNARAACNLYAALVAEKPDDIDTRLDYVRALTDAGDLALARLQLAAVLERVDENNIDGRLGIARRQLALGDAAQAAATLRPLLAKAPQRADLWYVAGRAELEQHHYAKAREYFAHAEMSENKDDALAARLVREEIDARKQSWMSAGIEYRYKPGDAGISRFDALVIPSYWRFARNYEERVTLHADAVTIDAGTLGRDFDEAALLGTIQAAGPNAVRRHSNDAQKGLSIGVGYETDTLAFDLGTTPLGFLLPNLVGGAEWSPRLKNLDVSLGVSRRAVTSSVLSYAGMRDPITGEKWGGVVETGPYAQLGFYRERYSLSGALKASDLSGTHVLDNTFYGARIASDWKFIAQRHEQAFVGITINYWRYDHDLQNYTFGAGGYYSPKSYLSIGLPLEVQGARGAWSYRVRAAVAHSTSDTDRIAFYPNDPALQAQALASALPSGYSEPYFDGGKSSSTSFSAYGAVERQLFREWVLGAKIDLDRSDYYHPTVFTFYVRHVFDGATTSIAVPPRPARGYN